MTIYDIFRVIIRRIVLVAAITLSFGAAAGAISWLLLDNVYEASAMIIVSSQKANQESVGMTYSDYNLNVQLVNSYQVLCKTDRVLSQVIEQTGLPLSIKDLGKKISVASQKDTEIISISVEDTDPATAQAIANSLADVFKSEVVSIMKMDNVQIIDYAEFPEIPVRPHRMQNLMLGLAVGLAVGVGIALLLDYLDITVKSADQVESILSVPILGVIPHIE
jgi:capsular polysaccharide biosynthesis protein